MTDVPEGAKKPTDRKPKAEKAPEKIKRTVNGIDVSIDAEALDDFELMDDIARIEEGDITRATAVLRRLLSDDDRRALLDSCRNDAGKITIEAGVNALQALLEAENPNS